MASISGWRLEKTHKPRYVRKIHILKLHKEDTKVQDNAIIPPTIMETLFSLLQRVVSLGFAVPCFISALNISVLKWDQFGGKGETG